MSLELVLAPVCPFAHRAWLTLLELGVPFKARETSLVDKPEWFSKLYATAVGADPESTGKVPVLVDGPLVLAESAVISEYLVNKFGREYAGDTALAPGALSPEEAAIARIFAEQVLPEFVGGFYTLMRAQGPEAQAAAAASLLDAYARVSAAYERAGGPFFAGARLSLTDILVWPWVARLSALAHYRGFAVPEGEPRFAAFHRFAAAMRARPSVQATQLDAVFVEGYRSYAEPQKQ